MANKQQTGKVTIANIVSMVGVALLMVFTFIGYSFKSGGELGMDLLITVGIGGFTALMLWFLVRAKGAENNLDKWKVAEIITLVVYIAFTVYTSVWGGMMHFFVVNENKESIKSIANEDIQKIDQLFASYEEFETNAVARTKQGLSNATARNQKMTDSLKSFMTENAITAANYEYYVEQQQDYVVGSMFANTKSDYEDFKQNIMGVVNSWSVVRVPREAKNIEEYAKAYQQYFTEWSESATLPVIEFDQTLRKYTITEAKQVKTYTIDGGIESLKFRTAITEAEGFSILAIIVMIVINILILFNYIMAFRTRTIHVGKDTEVDGGRILM